MHTDSTTYQTVSDCQVNAVTFQEPCGHLRASSHGNHILFLPQIFSPFGTVNTDFVLNESRPIGRHMERSVLDVVGHVDVNVFMAEQEVDHLPMDIEAGQR